MFSPRKTERRWHIEHGQKSGRTDGILWDGSILLLVRLRHCAGVCQSLSAGLRTVQQHDRVDQRGGLRPLRSFAAHRGGLRRSGKEPVDQGDAADRLWRDGRIRAATFHGLWEGERTQRSAAGRGDLIDPDGFALHQCPGHGNDQPGKTAEIQHRQGVRLDRIRSHVHDDRPTDCLERDNR